MMMAIAVTSGIFLILYLSGFFLFFTPLPVALMAVRRGHAAAVTSLGLGVAVLVGLYFVSSAPLVVLPLSGFYPDWGRSQVAMAGGLYALYLGWIGIVLGLGARSRLSLEKSLLVMVALSLIIPGGAVFVFFKSFGIHPLIELRSFLESVIDQMVKMQTSSGLSENETMVLSEYAPVIIGRVIQTLPAIIVNTTLSLLSLNILFLRRWSLREQTFPAWVDFGLWRLKEAWIWGPIAAGAVFFVNNYLLHVGWLEAVCINVLLILTAIYFFQGLAVVSFYFRRRLTPMVRMLSYFLILLFVQMFGFVIVGLGLFDFWFDFRKLKRVGKTP